MQLYIVGIGFAPTLVARIKFLTGFIPMNILITTFKTAYELGFASQMYSAASKGGSHGHRLQKRLSGECRF
ncbi:MAG: hypothetical protein NVSMB33_15020 [Ktedonobacteraceae bacterium]